MLKGIILTEPISKVEKTVSRYSEGGIVAPVYLSRIFIVGE